MDHGLHRAGEDLMAVALSSPSQRVGCRGLVRQGDALSPGNHALRYIASIPYGFLKSASPLVSKQSGYAGRHRSGRIPARNPPSSNTFLLISGALANFMVLIILLTFSYLREEPMFWTNAGGWSVEWRDLVQTGYYPTLGLELVLLLAYSGMSLHLLNARRSAVGLTLVMLPMLWGLFFMVILNSVANNIDNLLHGRPVHWHPGVTGIQLGQTPPPPDPPIGQDPDVQRYI